MKSGWIREIETGAIRKSTMIITNAVTKATLNSTVWRIKGKTNVDSANITLRLRKSSVWNLENERNWNNSEKSTYYRQKGRYKLMLCWIQKCDE